MLKIGQRWHRHSGSCDSIFEITNAEEQTTKCVQVITRKGGYFIGETDHWCSLPNDVYQTDFWTYLVGQDAPQK
jgi:hypothetical protein